MRVLQINTVCGTGSTGRIATDLAEILREDGHSCKVGYGRGEALGIPEEDAIKIGGKFHVYHHALATRFTDRTGFYSKGATKEFLKAVDRYNPDVIHLHNLHGYYLHLELLFRYLREKGTPVVWTLHDCWSFTGHCSHFDFVGCERWKTYCHHCPNKGVYPSSYVLDSSKRNFQDKKKWFTSLENMQIITPSHWLGDLVKQSFLQKYPVHVIHNGIDLEQFRPMESDFRARHNLEEKKIILGVASVWGERKGFEDFLKLAEMLEEGFKIVLVGVNEKEKKRLPASVQGISRTNNVRELAEIYSTADVFANPTYEDNFPTTNLEALACGTPVVTYRTGGSPECLDETCGRIVEKGNLVALKEEILSLSEKSAEVSVDCAARGRLFGKQEKYRDYFGVYQ